ncbi:MAG: BON domain-containing protein [Planctomycetaceae bacterium]|jgi:hypothetical protein|nr:BON domain-containing protein [Planctomycetaceae bacterium]
MLRFYSYTIVFFLAASAVAVAQNTELEQPTDWGFLRTEVQTRLGKVRIDEIPDTIEFDHPRFYSDFKMGRFNTWLTFEPDAPNFRFRPIPEQKSQQSQYLPDVPPTEKTNKRIVSANTVVSADTSTNSSTQPVHRLPGFFERSGIMDAAMLPEESPIRTSTGSRWFRDIDRNNYSGLSGLSQRSRTDSGGNDYFNGNAVMVGGELLQDPPIPQQTLPQKTQSLVSATETGIQTVPADRQSATKNQVETLRRFEQKLERMLLSHPSIHFLSPVQITFRNGVVTVRGVVPDKEHKIAAGNLLLTDPAVKQVNNLISVVPADPTQITAPIEPK